MVNKVFAARLHEVGEPLRVENIDIAPPGADEVTIDLSFAGVNPIDRYVATGSVGAGNPLPRTLGGEGSGYLDGRPVLVVGGGLGVTRDGTFAGAVTCPREAVTEAGEGTDLRQLAAMGVAGLTAWNVVTQTAKVTGQDRVLVLGAGGGVGIPIVSVASAVGAEVWGQVSTPTKAAAVSEVGASNVLVCDAAGLADAATSFSPTIIIDALGGHFTGAALSAMAPGGTLVSYGASAGADASINLPRFYRSGQSIVGYAGGRLTTEERRVGLVEALAALADGRLRVRVDRVLPLAEVNEAFALLVARGVTGKLLLDLKN
jgi:NADPH2:quinone reductase